MLPPLNPTLWDRAKAAHLLNRAGFGGPPEEIDALVQGGMAAALRRLVDGPATPVAALPPEWAKPRDLLAVREQIRAAVMAAPAGDEAARRLARQGVAQADRRSQQMNLLDLGAWWLERMRAAADPLEEKMTLFWHGNFATSSQKVQDAYLMWRQNQTFREHARGNFGTLTKAMSRDPAMLIWLDLQQSRPPHANENFARELMELFTLGEGNYTERDVTESARAFTGYRIEPRDQSFRFNPRDHDGGAKQFLGRTGNLDGDNIIDIILEQGACARHIARNLWTFFASGNPPPALVDALAATLRQNRYEVRPVLRQMFGSAEFYAPDVIRAQIKSPVQWLVQTTRVLDGEMPPPAQVFGALRAMGQVPFMPPSVKGWDGGKAWISTSTLLFRYNFAQAMLHGPAGPALTGKLGGLFKGNKQGRLDNLLTAAMGGPDEGGAPPAVGTGNAFGAGVNGMTVVPLPPSALVPPPLVAHNRVDLQRLVPEALRSDPDAVLRSLTLRLFQAPVPAREAAAFSDYLHSVGSRITDQALFGLLHLMMSTPAYQLC